MSSKLVSRREVFQTIAAKSYCEWPVYDSTPLYDKSSLHGLKGNARTVAKVRFEYDVHATYYGFRLACSVFSCSSARNIIFWLIPHDYLVATYVSSETKQIAYDSQDDLLANLVPQYLDTVQSASSTARGFVSRA